MNVNRLYIANIFVFHGRKSCGGKITYGSHVKPAIVYHTNKGEYLDLFTKEKYKLGNDDVDLGDLYIYLKDGLMPMCDKIDVKFGKLNMPRRKIKKKLLSTAALLKEKEDDK